MDIFISFVLAFLIGGALCAIFQVFAMLTKLHPPQVLIIGFSLGGLLVPFGAIAFLEHFGGGGVAITVLDAGAALCGTLIGLFTQGQWLPVAIVLGIFIALTAIGVITGMIADKLTPTPTLTKSE
jgi:hypothetical protein